MKKNKKKDIRGFTLIELIATIVILALVISIGSYSVITIINNSKENDLKILISNVKDAAEVYYQECLYGTDMECESSDGVYQVTYDKLVEYGYLKGNATDNSEESKNTVINPKTDKNIGECVIEISEIYGETYVVSKSSGESCPNVKSSIKINYKNLVSYIKEAALKYYRYLKNDYQCGNVDNDGVIDILDVLKLLKLVAFYPTSENLFYDYNSDNIIDSTDVSFLLQKTAGITDEITCPSNLSMIKIPIGELLYFGYLKSNADTGSDNIVNPEDNNIISECMIEISEVDGNLSVSAIESDNQSCPSEY